MIRRFFNSTGLVFIFLCYSALNFAQQSNDFELSKQFYLQGNSLLIGNNILSQHKESPVMDQRVINDQIDMVYVNIDKDKSTFSSSSATIKQDISGSKVKYAALYWSAIYKYDKGKKRVRSNREIYVGNNSRNEDIHKIKFKIPGKNYIDLNGTVIFDSFNTSLFDETKPYVCYADVTSVLRALPTINGEYTAANIRATEGFISGGSSAGWLLYVIYEDENESPKYFTTYNGLNEVSNNANVDMVFKDFMALDEGEITSSLVVGALEGDHRFRTDRVFINDVNQNRFIPLENSLRPSDNFFNSTITINDEFFNHRVPASLNTLGYDLLKINIPTPENYFSLNETSEVQLRFTTRTDRFFLFFVGFETEISNTFFAEKTGIALPQTTYEIETKIEPISITDSFENSELQHIYDKTKNQPSTIIPGKQKGYYLITNVFSRKRNAQNWKNFLVTQGFQPKSFINPENNWEYIYTHYNESLEIMMSKLAELSTHADFKDAWILKMNL